MSQKIHHKNSRFARTNSRRKITVRQLTTRHKIKIRYLIVALAVAALSFCGFGRMLPTMAAGCPDVKILFARGSGEKQDIGESYLAFRASLQDKLATTKLSYEFVDIQYPAVSIAGRYFTNAIGAFLSGGEGYGFGRSMNQGYRELVAQVTNSACPQTKYVLGGYSQGAIIVDKTLKHLQPKKLIYAATFGDPKIYLPEGAGPFPAACRGENLSEYRRYVPDCQAYMGILGPYVPYRAEDYVGKVGTWCASRDVLCSHYFSIASHESYVKDNLYEDASRIIFDKISTEFGLDSRIASPHDTVILIDSTSSMAKMIDRYKAEALRLARETLEAGGRVALYDYRDLRDPYEPHLHCDFFTCDLATIESALNNITVGGGGDKLESLLSTSLHAMKAQKWQYGAVKSVVVLTDDGFLSPDFDDDHTTLDDVVKLSKSIDPVNFYIITKLGKVANYTELANRTDGRVVTDPGSFSLMTDYILDRYDSLPRVEEADPQSLPTLDVESVEHLSDSSVRLKFSHTGTQAMVFINDMPFGVTTETELTITDLDPAYRNTVSLVPMTESLRGESVTVELNDGIAWDNLELFESDSQGHSNSVGPNESSTPETNLKVETKNLSEAASLPKAPNTSRAKINPHFALGIIDGFSKL